MTESRSSPEQAGNEGTGDWRGPNAATPVNVPEDGQPAVDGDVVNTAQPGDPTAEKDPDDWVTGDEPATGAQISCLETLACRVGLEIPQRLTKADASRLIDSTHGPTRTPGTCSVSPRLLVPKRYSASTTAPAIPLTRSTRSR